MQIVSFMWGHATTHMQAEMRYAYLGNMCMLVPLLRINFADHEKG